MKYLPGLAAIVALLILPMAAHGVQKRPPADVDGARIVAANREPGSWLTNGRTYDEQRYSPLDQINASNVGQLGLAWSHDLNTLRGVEAAPLYVDGVLYNISAWNITTALDARTGKVLWTYDPKVPAAYARWACCDVVSRGVAVWKGKVIIATLDGRLIALDATTGRPVWTARTFEGQPYSVTGAPRVFDGKVLIGNGGGDFGARGYVTAYDADTGKRIWRFYVTPGDPAKGFESKAMAMAARTWSGEWWKVGGGGGGPWDSLVYDPKLRLVYIGTGNGGPYAESVRSPGAGGDNLFLSSIVAVKVDTGDYVWHFQETPGEEWDYTATQPLMLADLNIGGRVRKVIMHAPKNGFFYVLDRVTGQFISAKPYVAVNWARSIDPKTGRPDTDPIARFGDEPVLLTPGPAGGHNWHPMSYSPKTGLVYFPVQEGWFVYPLSAGSPETRSAINPATFAQWQDKARELRKVADEREKGWLTAWDPVTQKEVWRVPYPRPGSGGTLATAGNLVVEGTPNKTLAIYRADTGKKLWETDVQSAPVAGAISYMLDGQQYIAINAGWGGGAAVVDMASGKPPLQVAPARLLVFKLGGTASLPPAPPELVQEMPAPPLSRAPEAQVQKGALLYSQTCARCHGVEVRGGLKDLRYMTRPTHGKFNDIVMHGAYQAKGMANFSDVLSQEDADAIHAYITARANEDWFKGQK